MPEYLAPGVYVEETSFRSKSIEGVSTTTTGFIGPTRYGPSDMVPDVLTSLADFERVYGDHEPLEFTGGPCTNYMWHSVRAFFENGGKRLYVVRMVDDGAALASGPVVAVAAADAVTGDGTRRDFTTAAVGSAIERGSLVITRRTPIAIASQDAAETGGTDPVKEVTLDPRPDAGPVTVTWKSGNADKRQIITGATAAGDGAPANTTLDRATGILRLDMTGAPRDANTRIKATYAAVDTRTFVDDGNGQVVGRGLAQGVTGTVDYATGALTLRFATAPGAGEAWQRTMRRIGAEVRARFRGAAGNGRLEFTARAGAHLGSDANALLTRRDPLQDGEIVEVLTKGSAKPEWRRARIAAGSIAFADFAKVRPGTEALKADLPLDDKVVRVARASSVRVTWTRAGQGEPVGMWDLDARPDAMPEFFGERPESDERRRTLPVVVSAIAQEALYGGVIELVGGTDGNQPDGSTYEGRVDPATDTKTGLKGFEDIEDISIVAAPGLAGLGTVAGAVAGVLALQAHVELMRYRVAVVDPPRNQSIGEVRQFRARFDSKHMALYYPWVRIRDPLAKDPTARAELDLPPCGFVAGIYARNDIQRAVYKAPANEVVALAVDFERAINRAQQEVLNPEGINCLRFFEGRGMRVWGARTMSSDPEWKYVNVRRYFAYLEHSIDRATQWAVFEPNGPLLWGNIRRSIEDFLLNEYQSGALLGDKPEKAFFVRCDRSTMTQNDLDNGRLVCLIGVAPLKPAEFVIFRIGQWTADAKN